MEYKGKERGYRGRGGGRGGRHGGNGRGHGGRGRGRDGRGRGRGGGDGRANRHSSEEFTNYQKEYINQCEKILTIITDKNYKYISSDEEKIDMGQEMSKCINLTLFKKSLTRPSKKEFKPNQCEINMSKLSTIGCARDMHQKGFKNIVVMNFASPFKPGGFYKKGKSSQEMNIISQTLLFGSLLSEAAKPFYFQRDKADDYDFYNNGLIYSPHVPVIADGEARLKEAREKDEEQSTSHYKKKFILYGKKNVFYIDVISISSISNSLIRRVQGGGRKFRGNDDGNRRGGYHNHSDRQKDYNQRRGSHDDNDRRHGDRDDYHGGRHDRGDHRQGDRNDHRGGRNDRDHDDHRGGRHDRDHDDHHRHGSDDMIKSAMEQKIRNTIYMAVSANADALVLGAFGCGSSGNHPSTISKLFKKVLIEDGYASYFKRIDFSLPEIFPKGKVDIIQVFSKNLLISKKCSSDSDSSNNDEYVDNDEEEEEEEFNESDSNKNDDDDNDYDHRDDSKAKNDKAGKNENKAKNDKAGKNENKAKNDNKKKSDNKSKNSKQKQDDKEKNDDECSNSDNEEK